jgi:hypothetical protein
MNKNRKREQSQKPRNEAWMRAEQERRRSSVASPHRNKAKYNRKSKYKEF